MKLALVGDLVVRRCDFDNSEYLTPRQKAFLKANKKLVENTRKGKSYEQKKLVRTYDAWEADLSKKKWYESVDDFVERALEEGIAIRTGSVVNIAKEVERNTYTEHIFDDGTVVGEVERLTW